MNLNNNPTLDQLKRLFAACDDSAGHHILWVDAQGEVHLSQVPDELSPVGFEQSQPQMKMRYETFQRWNDYVGPEAAQDTALMSRILDSLVKEWPDAQDFQGVAYVDSF